MSRRHKNLPQGEFTAQVTGLDHEGRGVARIDGKVTFIADALPDETVRFAYTSRRNGQDEGKLLAVDVPSPDRVTPECAHFGVCGGCALQHLAVEKQILFKQDELIQALNRIGGVSPKTVATALTAQSYGYRRRARLGVKIVDKKGGALVGFRERSAHYLAQLERCVVLDPRVGLKLKDLGALIDGLSIRQAVPQIEAACGTHVALVFRVMQNPSEDDRAALAAFGQTHGFEIFLQPKGLDSIAPLNPPTRGLRYSPDGSDTLLAFEPSDFIQVNGPLSEAMVRQALDWLALKPGETVLELFAGLGNFTVPLAQTGAQVTAVEGEAGLVQRGRDNCTMHGLDVEWHVANLFEPEPKPGALMPYLKRPYDAILLDPPRAGAEAITPYIAKLGAQRILYVSCHPGTLARDSKVLAEAGYRLERAGVMDMFPHTAHVESMALFIKG